MVPHEDRQPLACPWIEARHVPREREQPPLCVLPRARGAHSGSRRQRGGERQFHERQAAPGQLTTTTALFALSGPRQLAAAGVTVYRHDPVGTLLSVHVSAVIVPAQPFSALVPTPVMAL